MENFINESVIIAIATVIFTFLSFKPAKKSILGMLDNKILEIASKIKQAEDMKNEAEAMLNQIQEELNNARTTAKDIIESAKLKSKNILEDAKKEMEVITKRRTDLTIERISQQEKLIIEEFKHEVLKKALTKVEESFKNKLTPSTKKQLVEYSINNLKRNLN